MRLLIGTIAIVINLGLFAQAEVKNSGANEAGQASKAVLDTEAGYDKIISEMNKDLERNTVYLRQKTLVLPAKTILTKGKGEGDACKTAENQEAADNDCLKLEVFDFQDSEIGKSDYGYGSRTKYIILFFDGPSTGTGDPFKEAPRKVKKLVFNFKTIDFYRNQTDIANLVDNEPYSENTGATNDFGGAHDDKILVYYTMGSPELNFQAIYSAAETSANRGEGNYNLKNVENTKTHPIRNEFKKAFLAKNLLYFRETLDNIADFNHKAALEKYKRNKEFIRASLKY
jgi:hypothetical protein